MKKLFIVANWKSYKTTDEASVWLQAFDNSQFRPEADQALDETNKEIIICPSFTLLSDMKKIIEKKNLPIKLGAQTISSFEEGAFTGEVNGKQVKEFADYVLIGHSERRMKLVESDEMISKKVEEANKNNILSIFCVQGIDTPIPEDISIVAYEPVAAIGTGNPDTPENAEMIAKIIKDKYGVQYVLYGGSVNGENVSSFTKMESINGVLVGGVSLDVNKFSQIIENA